MKERKIMAKLTYSLWFKDCAADAVNMYADLFEEACITGRTVLPDTPSGDVEIFTGAFSLVIECDNQSEIDGYWEILSQVPEAEACGWCQDHFGITWQIVPEKLTKTTMTASRETLKQMQEVYYPMKKFIMADLEEFLD